MEIPTEIIKNTILLMSFTGTLINGVNTYLTIRKNWRDEKEAKRKEEERIKLETTEKEKLQKIAAIKEKIEQFKKEYENDKTKVYALENSGGFVLCDVEKRVDFKSKKHKHDPIYFPLIKSFDIKEEFFIINEKEYKYEEIDDIEYYWFVLENCRGDKTNHPRIKFSELIKKGNSKLEKYDLRFGWPKDIDDEKYKTNQKLNPIKEELKNTKEEEIEIEFLKNLKTKMEQ